MYDYYVRVFKTPAAIEFFQVYRINNKTGSKERLCHKLTRASVMFKTMLEATINCIEINYVNYHFIESDFNENFSYYLIRTGE